MSRTVHQPAGLFDSLRFGFAQLVVIDSPAGRVAHVSGQVAWDVDRRIVGESDLGSQLRQCLRNLQQALQSVEATLEQVGSLTLYIRQDRMDQGAVVSAVLREVFGNSPPCATWVGVTSLADPSFLIEVQPAPILLSR